MSEQSSSSSGEEESRQPFTHEDMLERIQTPRTTGMGRSGRKRKRRTNQPKKRRDTQRRVLMWAFFGTAIPVVLGILLGILWNDWRCESETFRKQLSEHLTERLGAKVHVGPLKLEGRLFIAQNVAINGTGENGFKYAEFRRVRARLSYASFFQPGWQIESLAIEECDLHFSEAGRERPEDGPGSAPAAVTAIASPQANLGLDSAPVSWIVDALQIRTLNVFWGSVGAGSRASGLQGSRVFSGSYGEDGALFLMGGVMSFDGIAGFELENADLRIDGSRLVIEKATLSHESKEVDLLKSTIELSGELDFDGSNELSLDVTVAGMQLDVLTEKSWRGRMGGVFNGNLRFEKRLGSGEPRLIEGPFYIQDAWLKDLQVLDLFARITGDSRFRRVEFTDGYTGVLRMEGKRLSITDLKMERGSLKVEGKVAVGEDGGLSGELMVGLPDAILLGFPGGKPEFFGEADAGYSFAEVEPQGMLVYPQENLSPRLVSDSVPAGVAPQAASSEENPAARAAGSGAGSTEKPFIGLGEKAKLEQLFEALLKP